MTGYDVIVSGHLCADLLPETSTTPLSALSSPGKLSEIGALEISTGGSVSNTGLALHRLGLKVGLMTTIGDDLLGRVIIAKLKDQDESLADLVKVRSGVASSYSILLSPHNADRIILHCPGNNAHFDVGDVDFETVNTARVFHLGYPPILPGLLRNDGDSLEEIFRRVSAAGLITSMDMAYPDPNGPSGQVDWRRILARVLPYVTIFLPSIEEIVFMLRREDHDRWQGDVIGHLSEAYLRDLAEEVLALGVAICGFKLGEYGFYLRTTADASKLAVLQSIDQAPEDWRDIELWQPTFQVQVVGTTGAGDCAIGGFIAALLYGLGPKATLQTACAVGACNVESADATSAVQSWEATQQRIASGWAVSDVKLPHMA